MANYLGLTIETVSRTFSWLQKQDLLAVRGKLVSIVDINGLLDVAGREHEDLLVQAG
ncbi:MAG: helix-turn-helix domain-containing protein [Wenzhouxiangellaceae bacterium]